MTVAKPTPRPVRVVDGVTLGQELRARMKAGGVRVVDMARAVGVAPSAVIGWRSDTAVPRLQNAAAAAELLDWPDLIAEVKKARTKLCADCSRPFIHNSTMTMAQYCGERCRKNGNLKRVRGVAEAKRTKHAFELKRARRAIDRMCNQCEPEGLCRDAQCPLREVSMLPLHRAAFGRKSA